MTERRRYHALDVIRGFSLLLMVLHHWGYDLVDYDLLPSWMLHNGIVDALHIIFASVFVAISGACSTFSRSNLKRGLVILAAALAVTGATYIFDQRYYVKFGILHFLGCAALIYELVRRFGIFRKVPKLLWLLLFALSYPILFMDFNVDGLSFLGFKNAAYASYDYFPILPWIFMYFLGTALGEMISAGRFPEFFYRIRSPFLEKTGKASIWIYLLHQPILLGVTMGIAYLAGTL